MNILRVFSDHHLWHQNWRQYLWTSLCQFNFFVNLLHSLGVWIFDIWHLFDNLTSFWHFQCKLSMGPIAHVPNCPCGPYPCTPYPQWASFPICPIQPVPHCPLCPYCPYDPYPLYSIPSVPLLSMYSIPPVGLIAHMPHTPCTPLPPMLTLPIGPIAHVTHTPSAPLPMCPMAMGPMGNVNTGGNGV